MRDVLQHHAVTKRELDLRRVVREYDYRSRTIEISYHLDIFQSYANAEEHPHDRVHNPVPELRAIRKRLPLTMVFAQEPSQTALCEREEHDEDTPDEEHDSSKHEADAEPEQL